MLSLVSLVLLTATPLEVAVLSKSLDGNTLEARWLSSAATVTPEPFAHLDAAVDETFHGVVLPGTRSIAVVRVPGLYRDPSFAATLELITPGAPTRRLATGLVRASKPHLVAGRLFVERGTAGIDRGDGTLRVDALEIDEVDVTSGRLRPVHQASGSWTHLAGAIGRELIVYEAGPSGARVIAVHVDSLAVRPIVASLPPLAHDFWVDAKSQSILFTIAEPGVERWFVDRVEVASGKRQRLTESDSVALLPAVVSAGVVVSRGPGAGLRWASSDQPALPSHGQGYERVRFVNDTVTIVRHETPGALPFLYAVRSKDGKPIELPWPTNAVVELAGVAR